MNIKCLIKKFDPNIKCFDFKDERNDKSIDVVKYNLERVWNA